MDAIWLQIVQWLHSVGMHVDANTVRDVAEGARHVTDKLDMPSMIALAAALGWASGFRLYAVVFLVARSALRAGFRCLRGCLFCRTPWCWR